MKTGQQIKISGKLLASISAALVLSAAPSFAGPVEAIPDRIMIQPRPGVAEAVVDQIVSRMGATEVDRIPQLGIRVIKIRTALRTRLQLLKNDPNLAFAETDFALAPDGAVNDPYFGRQWHLAKIKAVTAWDKTSGAASIPIAILDSGIDGNHPDLAGKLLPGWNFYENNANTTDVFGHGTAVAGAVASLANNNFGAASVAWSCPLLPIRVTDRRGFTTESALVKALCWAADAEARVAIISFRGSGSKALSRAAAYFAQKNGITVMAAGNERLMDRCKDDPSILLVSATDSNDQISSWSNYGNNIDVCAPGEGILTLMAGADCGWWSGTSFAAPLVGGVAALVMAANPGLHAADVRDVVKASADDVGQPGWDAQTGWGRVNAEKAVLLATSLAGPARTAVQNRSAIHAR